MRPLVFICATALTSLLLAGCATAATPARTVTVTATPPAPSAQAGDTAPWDLQAICAAESQARTLIVWRDQQTRAGRLTASQSSAVLQAVAVQYLGFDARGVSAGVKADVETLRDAAGTLEEPDVDLQDTSVERARDDLAQACQDAGLPVGVLAQGG